MSNLWNDLRAKSLVGARPDSWEDYLDSLEYAGSMPDAQLKDVVGCIDFGQPLNISDAIRWEVWERDDFTCQECGSRRFLSVDHVYAKSRNGPARLWNLRTLCRSCNSKKGAKVVRNG